jgi:tRNA uridine 5-carbamoylmethylation protein Kti12
LQHLIVNNSSKKNITKQDETDVAERAAAKQAEITADLEKLHENGRATLEDIERLQQMQREVAEDIELIRNREPQG